MLGVGLVAPVALVGRAGPGATPPGAAVEAQTGLRHRVVVPWVGTDGPRPTLRLSIRNPFQGGAIYLEAAHALAGEVRLFGRSFVLSRAIAGLEGFVGVRVQDPPGPAALEVQLQDALGGTFQFVEPISIRATQWTSDDIWLPPRDPNAPAPPRLEPEQPRLDALYATVTPRQWDMPFTIPMALGGSVWISGYFGEQRSFNGGPRRGHHHGTDIAAPMGTLARVTNHGTVVMSELTLVRGELVVVDHGAGVLSSYAHLSQRTVAVGQQVERGDVVGRVGSTGFSTGPHLHWELTVAGVLVDGLRWLDRTQGF